MPNDRLVPSVPPIDWKHQVDRRAAPDQFERRGHVRQDAALRGDRELAPRLLQHAQQRVGAVRAVGRGIDADHRVTGGEHQPIEDAGGDAGGVVRRVVGLQTDRQPARQADRVAEPGGDRAAPGDHDQVLQAAKFSYGGHHLGREAGRQCSQRRACRVVGEQPIAQAADRQVGDRCERRAVMRVADQPRDFVSLVGNDRVIQQTLQREIGQRHLRRDPLLLAGGGDSGEGVSAAMRRRPRQESAQVRKAIGGPAEAGREHAPL